MLGENHGTVRDTGMKPMLRIVEWLLGIIAVVTSVAGLFLTLQQLRGTQYSGPMFAALFTDLWPLPSLALIGWVLLSLLGLYGIALDARTAPSLNQNGRILTALAGGALLALALLSMFSIGSFVLIAALALSGAALLASLRARHPIGRTLLAILIGAATGFLLLILLITTS
jgi:hypothetical protein